MTTAGSTASPAGGVEPALLERLVHAGEQLPDDVRESFLRLDRAVAGPALVQLLECEPLADVNAAGGGYAPIHAVALLETLRTPEAIEPMLRVLAGCDALEILYSRLIFALQAFGAPALEPVLAAYAAAQTEDRRMALEDVLAGLRVRDDRILRRLLDALERAPEHGASLLAEYGDDAALPALAAALDACEPYRRGGFVANSALIELEAAIAALGGTFTPDQERKLEPLRAARRAAMDHKGAAADGADDREGVLDGDDTRAQVLEQFAASPHAAFDGVSDRWVELSLRYAAEYLEAPFAEIDEETLEEIVFEILPRKVSCGPDAAAEAIRSLRAFWTFARDVLDQPHAEDCLEVLGDGAVGRLERALSEPSNFGLAKSLFMSGAMPARSERGSSSGAGSREDRKQKKLKRKQRRNAQRRNRR